MDLSSLGDALPNTGLADLTDLVGVIGLSCLFQRPEDAPDLVESSCLKDVFPTDGRGPAAGLGLSSSPFHHACGVGGGLGFRSALNTSLRTELESDALAFLSSIVDRLHRESGCRGFGAVWSLTALSRASRSCGSRPSLGFELGVAFLAEPAAKPPSAPPPWPGNALGKPLLRELERAAVVEIVRAVHGEGGNFGARCKLLARVPGLDRVPMCRLRDGAALESLWQQSAQMNEVPRS